jgi:hypothetical protein
VHLLVLAAFHGPRPGGHVGGVLNGDWTDLRAANLGWVTRTVLQMRNRRRMQRAGTVQRAARP